MTELELLELLRAGNDGIDSNFQFWISSSFAILMAFYFAHGKIIGYVKWTAISLYVSSTVLFFIRMSGNGLGVIQIRASLEEIGSELAIYGGATGGIIGLLFISIVILGTLATLYFCIFSEKFLDK